MNNPGTDVETAAAYCLSLAQTWVQWDGQPIPTADGERVYTPHKAIRRIADHIVDHLAEVEALLCGAEPQPDRWGASEVTVDADLVPFNAVDLQEASERITRLARTFALRLAAAGPETWDEPRSPNWTLREIAVHLSNIRWYADQVGRLPSD